MTWLLVSLCLLISFLFSGVEAGILSINRVRIRQRMKTGDSAAIRLHKLLQEPERLLMTVVIVTNLMNIFAVTLTAREFVEHFGRRGYLFAFLAFFPLYLFTLELFPKSLFRRFPYRLLALFAVPLRLVDRLLSPVLLLGMWLAKRLIPINKNASGRLFAAREDFKYFTLESERTGTITPLERELIHNVVDFRTLTARDLMRPLSEFATIPADAEIQQLIDASEHGMQEKFLALNHSGEIVGMVDLFETLLDRDIRSQVSSCIRPLFHIPATEGASRLLHKFRASRTPVALVMDEEKPVGLVFKQALYKQMISPSYS